MERVSSIFLIFKKHQKVYAFGFLLLMGVTFSRQAFTKVLLPDQMTQGEMRKVLQILGPATGSTPLSSPYPLGGWEGFEIGISKHYLPWSYLSEVDPLVAEQKDLEYPLITLGKGLFYDFDLFLSITPILKSDVVNYFSTHLRYQFWNSQNKVLRLSALIFAGTANVNNQLNMQNNGFDLIGTITLDRVSIFAGVGSLVSNGRFIGGQTGITASKNTEAERIFLTHQLVGIEWPIGNFFIAAEADRYAIPYYSVKLGYRR